MSNVVPNLTHLIHNPSSSFGGSLSAF